MSSSRSVSVASIPRLRSLKESNDDEKRSHRRSWSLGPLGRKMKTSRPGSLFLLRRNTDFSGDTNTYPGNSRPHSWLGLGLDVSRTHGWQNQQLPPTTYIDPRSSSDTVPFFAEPPSTPPPNSNGVIDSYLGVLPSPTPTSIHNRSQTDLRRDMGGEPPLPMDARERVLQSVMRHSSPPVNVPQLQAVQGHDPSKLNGPPSDERALQNQLFPEDDPDKTLTGQLSATDEFKKEIDGEEDAEEDDDDDDDDESDENPSEDSDPTSEEAVIETAREARAIKDGDVSPVGHRNNRESRRASAVSPNHELDRNQQERLELLAQRQMERNQVAQQTSYDLGKEVHVAQEEIDSSSGEDEPISDKLLEHNGNHGNSDGKDGADDLDQSARSSRGDSLIHDGSSATVVDEDDMASERFSFEDDRQVEPRIIENVANDDPGLEHGRRASRPVAPPTTIQLPKNTDVDPQPLNRATHLDSNESSDSETYSLPGDIVLTPTVQASQNPTPIFERPAKFEQSQQQTVKEPHQLQIQEAQHLHTRPGQLSPHTQQPLTKPEPAPEPMPDLNEPPVIIKRTVRRDSPLNYDAVPGARVPQRQPTILQALSNAVVNGTSSTAPLKQRTEGYVVRVVAAPEMSRPVQKQSRPEHREVPPPPPPKDGPSKLHQFKNMFDKPKVKTNVQVLDVAIPSPSVSLLYDSQEEIRQPVTPQKTIRPKVDPPSAGPSVRTPMGDETLVEEDPSNSDTVSSLKRHKHDLQEAEVPMSLHPAMRSSANPENVISSPLSNGKGKTIHRLTVTETAESPMSDDDLYKDDGGVIPQPSSQFQQNQEQLQQQPSTLGRGTTHRRVSVQIPKSAQQAPASNKIQHKAKDSLGADSLHSYSHHPKNDRTWRNSTSSVESSRPMSFVTLPRDEGGRPIERVDTISRKEREARVRKELEIGREPKSLKTRDNQTSVDGEVSSSQQNELHRISEPLTEEDAPPREQTDTPCSFQAGDDSQVSRPLTGSRNHSNHSRTSPVDADETYANAQLKGGQGNRPRHTPIVPIDPSQEHIAYQLSGYREATKKALEAKLQADPNFKKELEEQQNMPSQGPFSKSKSHVSFLDPGADMFKLKGKAAGIFKVLGKPQVQEIIRPGETEPRLSNVSGGSASSAINVNRVSTGSQPPESGKKKRFSGMQAIFKRPESVGGAHNPLKMFKPDPKQQEPKTRLPSSMVPGQYYQNVRAPQTVNPDRGYHSHSSSGRTSRQSNLYNEEELLRSDDDDEDDEQVASYVPPPPSAGLNRTGNTLSAIDEVQPSAVSPVETHGPHRNGRTPSPFDRTQPMQQGEPTYDPVVIPAAYDRSVKHLGYMLPRPPNVFEPETPPTPPSAESPTWRRDPRDPFSGPSQGPPRKFSSDTYAAHVRPDSNHRDIRSPSPPVVSPLSEGTSPPAHKRLFGRGIVNTVTKPLMNVVEQSHKRNKSKSDIVQQQERPWALALPSSEEEEEHHRLHKLSKSSQILGAPAPAEQPAHNGGPVSHPRASGPPPGFHFAGDGPQPPPGFQFAPEQPHLSMHMAAKLQHTPPPHQQSFSPVNETSYSPPPMNGHPPQIQNPNQHAPQTLLQQQQPPPPPLLGYREVLPRGAQQPQAGPVHQLPPRSQPSPAQMQQHYQQYPPPPQSQPHHYPPPPQEPVIPPIQDKHAPITSPAPRHPIHSEALNEDGPSFLFNATPSNSAHPNRNSMEFSTLEPGKEGVPDLPRIPNNKSKPVPQTQVSPPSPVPSRSSLHAPQVHANPRDSSNAPQVHDNPRNSAHAPQVHDNPRDSTNAPQVMPALSTSETGPAPTDVALPRSPAISSPINPIAKELPVPMPEQSHQSSKNDPPEGIAELSGVPKGEEEEEPVMLGVSYPGMEWQPSWEEY